MSPDDRETVTMALTDGTSNVIAAAIRPMSPRALLGSTISAITAAPQHHPELIIRPISNQRVFHTCTWYFYKSQKLIKRKNVKTS